MAQPLNYAEIYGSVIEQEYYTGLMFRAIYETPNNRLVKFTSAKTIQVPSITTEGFTDTNRDEITSFGRRVENTYTPYTLEHDREFDTLIDPMDVDETNEAVTIANTTHVFNTEQKIPEMDKYAVSKLYSEVETKGGTIYETALTVTNVLEEFDEMMLEMDEAEVPQDGRILYVTPIVNKLLKNAQEIQRSLDVRGEGDRINRQVNSLDDVTIIRVPSSRMKTSYIFNNGAKDDPGSKQINMLMFHSSCVYAPQKYDFVSLESPTTLTKGKWAYYERKYWDVFLIDQKKAGAVFSVETTDGSGD